MTAIIGMGVDIVDIARLSEIAARYGEKFLGKIFTADEIKICTGADGRVSEVKLAGRFAVKEAFYKALPRKLQKYSSWKSMQTLADEGGKPYIKLCDDVLKAQFAANGIGECHVSISHEKKYCVATVILQ